MRIQKEKEDVLAKLSRKKNLINDPNNQFRQSASKNILKSEEFDKKYDTRKPYKFHLVQKNSHWTGLDMFAEN